MPGWSLISFSSTLVQSSEEWVIVVSYWNWNIPAKYFSWLRTDYLPMQMTPHYCHAVFRKPADRHAIAASLIRDLARIREWCNHWYMKLHPNKTKALVVSRSWMWAYLMVTWSCQWFLSKPVQTTTSLAWNLKARSHSKTTCVVLFPVSLRELLFWGWCMFQKRKFEKYISLHCVWYRNAGWVQGCSQPLVASLSCVFFSFPWRRCLWSC